MSFKREGNDSNLLKILRRRRIKDLFSEEIPEDEAKLLSNGRLTCIVCPNYPIFDTVTMLGLHRNGRKHLHSLQIFEEKKKELKLLIDARKHQQYLKDGTTSIKMAPGSSCSGLSTVSPYDPRVRKFRTRLGDRKPKLDLTDSTSLATHSVSSTALSIVVTDSKETQRRKSKVRNIRSKHNLDLTESSPPVTKTKSVTPKPRHSHGSAWKDVCQHQLLEGPVMHQKQLKNIFKPKVSEAVQLKPYHSNRPSLKHTHQVHFPSKYKIESEFSNIQQFSPGICAAHSSLNKPNKTVVADAVNTDVDSSVPLVQNSNSTTQTKDCRKNCSEEMAQKYRLLQGSGWKRDWDGKWIKDEEAEFDSDEEPPDIL